MSECSSWAELDKITIASGFVAPAAVTATEAPKEAPTRTTRCAPSARAASTISFTWAAGSSAIGRLTQYDWPLLHRSSRATRIPCLARKSA